MARTTAKARIQISLTQDIYDRIEAEANRMGISPSAYMQMTMAQHFELKERMAQFKGLPEVMDRLEKLAVQTAPAKRGSKKIEAGMHDEMVQKILEDNA